jgi:hypothetical protein
VRYRLLPLAPAGAVAELVLVRRMNTTQRILHLSAITTFSLISGCATVSPVEDTIRVAKPFSEVVSRVSLGMDSEIKHGITFTRDAVKYRREDVSPDIVRFEVWTWAPDYGDQKPFAHVDVMRTSDTATDIRIRESSAGSGQKTYVTAKIRGWFPSGTQRE